RGKITSDLQEESDDDAALEDGRRVIHCRGRGIVSQTIRTTYDATTGLFLLDEASRTITPSNVRAQIVAGIAQYPGNTKTFIIKECRIQGRREDTLAAFGPLADEGQIVGVPGEDGHMRWYIPTSQLPDTENASAVLPGTGTRDGSRSSSSIGVSQT